MIFLINYSFLFHFFLPRLIRWQQGLVFSVKLHLSLIHYTLSLDLWPLTIEPYTSSLIPTFCSLSLFTVPFKKFRWGFLSFLSLLLLLLLLALFLSQSKVKSTPSPRPTGVWQYQKNLILMGPVSVPMLTVAKTNKFVSKWHIFIISNSKFCLSYFGERKNMFWE